MSRIIVLIFLIVCSFSSPGFSQQSVFDSYSGQRKWIAYQDNHRALYRILFNEAVKQLDERAERVNAIQTESEWLEYQKELNKKLGVSLKKFKKTPLNARVTGKLERERFTVEKIIFESHPGFYVTGCLFIPEKRENPAPTIVYCSGHSAQGFRSDAYQQTIINLVEKGFVVFAYDPIGQGERLQYLDAETAKSAVGGPTTGHSYAGAQTLLAGSSLSDYFIWDGVRAIDYLATRKEVDINRIGITGRSGGGTQSAMIAAYDERVLASAPECYITTFKRLLQSIGAQDAEQNPYGAIKSGIDITDFLHARTPKPTLIVTTTNDFFSQQGAREAFREAKKSYEAMGAANAIQFAEDLGGHQSTKKNREAVYAFFQKFLNLPGEPIDREIVPFSEKELWVTSTGQVGSSLKGLTVFDLNQQYFSKENIPQEELKERIRKISGVRFDRKLTSKVYTGKFLVDSIEAEVEKYFAENHTGDFALPIFVIRKKGNYSGDVTVWNHPSGKEELLKEPRLREMLNSGSIIVAADLPGIGELSDPNFQGDGFVKQVPFNYTFLANLVGKSIPGIQAEAIDILMQFVDEHEEFKGKQINAFVQGNALTSFLHFALFRSKFQDITILNTPETNDYFLTTKYYDPELAYNRVPGSLSLYELHDLIDLLPENSVIP